MAHIISLKNNIDTIVLFDLTIEKFQKNVLDLIYCSLIENSNIKIISTNNYVDLINSDVVIVSAGVTKKPGMNDDDLSNTNSRIIKLIGPLIEKFCPHAFVICITQPTDVMVKILQDYSKIKDNKIIGISNVLDSVILKLFLANKLNVATTSVNIFTLGGDYYSAIPLINLSNIAGITLKKLIKINKITEIELIDALDIKKSLLTNDAVYYTYASAAIAISESYLFNKKKIFTCLTKINNYFCNTQNTFFFTVPVKISINGVEEVTSFSLTSDETQKLNQMLLNIKNASCE